MTSETLLVENFAEGRTAVLRQLPAAVVAAL